ncbi:MAG: hypothetical protein KGM47_03790 [Acidobacteriota bacterium]|nr:hypothetical protein [Acidobacteriota bacterium]
MPGIPLSQEQERVAVQSVLSSKTFAKCANLANLLNYLCLKYFEGHGAELKEYKIGVEALGRPSDFDPSLNSVVRVEAHRLREKLKRYYETEGVADPLLISLTPGNYIPQFIPREAALLIKPQEAGGVVEMAGQGETMQRASVEPLPPAQMAPGPVLRVHRMKRRSPVALYLGIIAALAAAVVILAVYFQRSSRAAAVNSAAMSAAARKAAAYPAMESGHTVRILAGYSKERYIDRAGRVWLHDQDYSGGAETVSQDRFFRRTLDPTIFETSRLGDFDYNIPLAAGNYELRLYFAENTYGDDTLSGGGEGSRVFNVTMNGKPLLSNFDVLSDAAGTDVADIRVFKDVTPARDGYLHLRFIRGISDPFVNAIEIEPAPKGEMNPVRIVAQNDSFTDHDGHLWSPDCYFERGRLALRKIPVANTPDPGLYAGERFGHFSYAIPVAPGKYRLTLRFAETYFGPGNPGAGAAGSRVFDVYCNGVPLLQNFDIFEEAGGANRALEKTFSGLKPDAQGKLVLRFVPITNYASVNAIEVAAEP